MSAMISSKQHILEASRTFGSDLELQALWPVWMLKKGGGVE